jgi:hypothetical protein
VIACEFPIPPRRPKRPHRPAHVVHRRVNHWNQATTSHLVGGKPGSVAKPQGRELAAGQPLRMDWRNVATFLKRDVDISAEVGWHFGALFPNDANLASSVGSQEEPGLEDHIISRRRACSSFEGVIIREEEYTTRTHASRDFDLLVDRRACQEVHRIVLDPETKLMLHEHGELGCSRTRSAAISKEYVRSRTDLSDPGVELASEPRLLGPCSTEPLRPEDHRSLRQ